MRILKLDVTHELIGSKALNLKVIERSGCKVPMTYVLFNERISTKLIEQQKSNIMQDIHENLVEDRLYAVRSAKGIEDSINNSFAGIFHSVLNVKKKNIYEALVEVAKSYDNKMYKSKEEFKDTLVIDYSKNIKDAILIQEMINPAYSGVLFTRNPVNDKDEMIIEMVEGLGSQLDQEGIDPIRIYYEHGNLQYEESIASDDLVWINQVFKEALKVQKLFSGAIDCEWVYDGNDIYWLQVRPVTALSENHFFETIDSDKHKNLILKPFAFDLYMHARVNAWLNIAKSIDSNINTSEVNIVQSFYYRPYFEVNVIQAILIDLGLKSKEDKLLKSFDSGTFRERFSFTHKAFFHFVGWIEYILNNEKVKLSAMSSLVQLEDGVEFISQQLTRIASDNPTSYDYLDIYDKIKGNLIKLEETKIILELSHKRNSGFVKEMEYIISIHQKIEAVIAKFMRYFGKYLKENDMLQEAKDLVYVERDFLNRIIIREIILVDSIRIINHHKKRFMKHLKSELPNEIIGIEPPILFEEKVNRRCLFGVPMSKGRIKGRIRHITIDDEMDDIQKDEIVIIPYSDMVFEPVLNQAAGLMLKTGGILSHIAILARERNLPAITSVKGIDSVKEGDYVAIDCYVGEVIIYDGN